MSRASASRRTRSPAITGSAGTTCSWSAGRTSTARRSWSRRTRQASRRVRPPTASTRSSARTSAPSGSRTTSSRARRRRTTTASLRTSSARSTRRASSSSDETLGAFSATTGHTLPDRYIEGTCPICGFPNARGDQCDNCGNQLDPTDLIEPRSRIDGTPPVFRETKHLFLDLPAFKDELTEWISGQTGWRQNVRRFSLNFVQELKPRPITRDLDWGVPIPVAGYEDRDDKRIYVWFDAVIGYLSASIEWAQNRGTPDAWREWWQNPAAEHTYFMGKDNIVFHTVIWPSMLLGYGEGGEYGAGRGELEAAGQRRLERVPDDGGQEVQREPGRPDPRPRLPEPLRPRRAALLPHDRRAGDAGHGLHVGGVRPPQQRRARGDLGQPRQPHAAERLQELRRGPDAWTRSRPRTRRCCARSSRASSRSARSSRQPGSGARSRRRCGSPALGNQYMAEQAPWAKLEAERERAGTILYVALRAIDSLKMLLAPFLPFSAQRLHELLGYEDVIAGELAFRTVERGRRRARRAHGRLRDRGRAAGSRARSRRAGCSVSRRRSSPSSTPSGSSTRSSRGWRPRPPRDRRARAPRRVRRAGRHARRARARGRASRGSSRSAPASSRVAPRSTSPTATRACSRRSASIRTRRPSPRPVESTSFASSFDIRRRSR